MTPEEAIKTIEVVIADVEWNYPLDYSIAFETAIEALEKQISKRPYFEGDGYDENGYLIYDTWICPCCEERYEVDFERHKHCPNCGQALDWSDTND